MCVISEVVTTTRLRSPDALVVNDDDDGDDEAIEGLIINVRTHMLCPKDEVLKLAQVLGYYCSGLDDEWVFRVVFY